VTLKLLAARAGTVLPTLALVVAVSSPASPTHADQDEDPSAALAQGHMCSTASLTGAYGFTFQGVSLKPDGTHAAEFAGVGVETFDGHGTIADGRLMGIFNGQPFTPSFTGTYSVNADCTGTKTITINGQASHYVLVVVAHASEIKTAETDPGTLLAFTQVRK
jgi:hypothetical protein